MKDKIPACFRTPLIVYASIWAFCIGSFWLLFAWIHCGAAFHFFAVFYGILPLTTLVQSFLIGKRKTFIKYTFVVPVFFTVMYLLCIWGTFGIIGCAGSDLTFYVVMIFCISVVGLLFGLVWRGLRNLLRPAG